MLDELLNQLHEEEVSKTDMVKAAAMLDEMPDAELYEVFCTMQDAEKAAQQSSAPQAFANQAQQVQAQRAQAQRAQQPLQAQQGLTWGSMGRAMAGPPTPPARIIPDTPATAPTQQGQVGGQARAALTRKVQQANLPRVKTRQEMVGKTPTQPAVATTAGQGGVKSAEAEGRSLAHLHILQSLAVDNRFEDIEKISEHLGVDIIESAKLAGLGEEKAELYKAAGRSPAAMARAKLRALLRGAGG